MIGESVGPYLIRRQLGVGGMGTVYLAEHTLLGRKVALKVLLPEMTRKPDMVRRFFNEARAVAAIHHPGIVEVYDVGQVSAGTIFIAMEYLDGETLAARLARGRVPLAEAIDLVRQIAAALVAAHRADIVHRDLKPDNVFLARDADVRGAARVKLLDFGIAKLLWPDKGLSTRTGTIIGTPTYMAPEQCRGVAVDHRVDLYSLGCIWFELLTGQPPFRGEGVGDVLAAHVHVPAPRVSSLAPEVAPALDALVTRLLAKVPGERVQTASALRDALDELAIAMPVARAAAKPASTDDSVTRPILRSDGDTTEPNPFPFELEDPLDVSATAPRPVVRAVSPAATTQLPPIGVVLPGPPSVASTPGPAPTSAEAHPRRPSARLLVVGLALAAVTATALVVWFVS